VWVKCKPVTNKHLMKHHRLPRHWALGGGRGVAGAEGVSSRGEGVLKA